jgi:hypothetical protein
MSAHFQKPHILLEFDAADYLKINPLFPIDHEGKTGQIQSVSKPSQKG